MIILYLFDLFLGCFAGRKKAANSEQFFEEFEAESIDLYHNGIDFKIDGKTINKRFSKY